MRLRFSLTEHVQCGLGRCGKWTCELFILGKWRTGQMLELKTREFDFNSSKSYISKVVHCILMRSVCMGN
ncbi:hypothetical protein O6P43_015430 [Quillaja saponaria]|uniref:Uncharacterized protein n=1 Tax=Quillaja saponaria TaxID=32244 RepID=A0AAD7LYS5_QUISA|nr:hypothetical protein O6P43_015430 [Quillaja saponaria]